MEDAYFVQVPEYENLARELLKNTSGTDIDLLVEEKSKLEPEHKVKVYSWDNGKIYFWDGEKEKCISSEEELCKYIVKICEEYFKKDKLKNADDVRDNNI